MAFTTRSNRTTLQFSRNTPSMVGPGAYNIDNDMSNRPSYAPFASSSERDVTTGTEPLSGFTPGPGEYQSKSSVRTTKSGASSSTFVSRTNRDSDKVSRNPGPGAYKKADGWIKPSYRKPRGQKKASKQVQWVRVSSAPSIPTSLQSYGYEEDNTGDLVLQSAPSQGYWGSAHDSAGPGAYDPNKPKSQSVGTNFSRSKVHRTHPSEKSNTVGPGVYSTDHMFATATSATKTKKASASFVSKTGKTGSSKKKVGKDPVPGPGNYDLQHTSDFNKIVDRSVSEHYQFFGSKASRTSSFDGRSKSAVPGPGEYEPGSIFSSKGDDSELMDESGKAFQSSSLRFDGPANRHPGPGQYDSEPNMSSDLSRKIFGRNASFGATASRFVPSRDHTEKKGSPGPGSYTQKRLLRENRPNSVFSSSSNRFGDKDGKGSPAPGSYEGQSSMVSEAYKLRPSTAFVSSTKRTAFGGKKVAVGPGSYNVKSHLGNDGRVLHTHGTARPSSSFLSGNSRFADKKSKRTPLDIGPGAYEPAKPGGAMIKRSYNITVGALS